MLNITWPQRYLRYKLYAAGEKAITHSANTEQEGTALEGLQSSSPRSAPNVSFTFYMPHVGRAA
jgi:hypothetical protein